MANIEDLEIDVAEAHGKGLAGICLVQCLMARLLDKGVITHEDGAMITAVAYQGIDQIDGVPDDAKIIAKAAIKGVSSAWSRQVPKH
jgi:hypothetical protein